MTVEAKPLNAVLICGLGRLGQHCAALLKELGIPVFGLTREEEHAWEVQGMPGLMDSITFGDCRRHDALLKAGIESCRAVLVTTSDEAVNVSAALAARVLNPKTRLVVRSSQSNLNDLLQQRLGNLVAVDMAELPATAFALAAIGGETVGLFALEGSLLRVVRYQIDPAHPYLGFEPHRLNTQRTHVLYRSSASTPQPIGFHNWHPVESLENGDVIVTIQLNEPSVTPQAAVERKITRVGLRSLKWATLRSGLGQLWSPNHQPYRVGVLALAAVLAIHFAGVMLYRLYYPEISLLDAFNVATVLIFDGYSNMFAQLKLPFPIPLWLLLFSLFMTMSGAVVTGILYAFITARVLSSRLQFRRRRGHIPRSDHVVVVGAARLARRVVELVASLGRPVVCITPNEIDPGLLPDIPVITGDPREGLNKANCTAAASVAVLTDDDMTNLEIALMASRSNENCRLVIRTDDAEFGRNVESLAPHTYSMSPYVLSAEAYAAAALGEKVISLLRLERETVMVVEFTIESGDGLAGELIAEIAYGYGVVAVMYQRSPPDKPLFFPSDDIRVEAGGRLVVLSTVEGLQRIEHQTMGDRGFSVRLLRALSPSSQFEGARIITRVTGCELGMARARMSQLPTTLPMELFGQQAFRLVRELRGASVEAEVVTSSEASLARADV